MRLETVVQHVLTSPLYFEIWVVFVLVSLGILVRDLRANNEPIGSLMKFVWGLTVLTFGLAYVAGFAMTMGPLMQEGIGFTNALTDALYSETTSITVMEIVAVGTDILLAGEAHIGDLLFWTGLVFSLTLGLAAAYPVNVLLIEFGVKEGMMNPKEMA